MRWEQECFYRYENGKEPPQIEHGKKGEGFFLHPWKQEEKKDVLTFFIGARPRCSQPARVAGSMVAHCIYSAGIERRTAFQKPGTSSQLGTPPRCQTAPSQQTRVRKGSPLQPNAHCRLQPYQRVEVHHVPPHRKWGHECEGIWCTLHRVWAACTGHRLCGPCPCTPWPRGQSESGLSTAPPSLRVTLAWVSPAVGTGDLHKQRHP